MIDKNKNLLKAHTDHPRTFEDNLFTYPVLSRRSGGISLGINLSPHKGCNFDCPYCQVDRSPGQPEMPAYDLHQMELECRHTIELILSGKIFDISPFDQTPDALRRFNDIALSGDGEPTAEKEFLATCQAVVKIKQDLGLNDVKIVIITNATRLDRPDVQQAMELLDENNGQIWAKLDAGTEDFYKFINKTSIPFRKILDNIILAGKQRPVMIQTLFTQVDGQPISDHEVDAYIDRLNEILSAGAKISLVQLHTIARRPADQRLSSLTNDQLDKVAKKMRQSISIPVEIYYGGVY